MRLNLKPTHAKVREYYDALHQYGQLNISHESAVRQAFASLLDTCARQFKWKLVQEFRIPNKSIIVDGVVLDTFTLKHGFWEAKDLKDQLEKEIKRKLDLGYPKNNTIFQSPERAILYQRGLRVALNEDIRDAANLVELLKVFYEYREPQHEEWETAVTEFSSRIPEIAGAVKDLIHAERKKNTKFVAAFDAFVQLCRQAINPNLSEDAVETMLIQHLLTERIFRKVFNNPEFTRRNIIAAEIEKVIDSLTSKHFSRDAFLKDLDRFYHAIEVNAENATDYSEKQTFLNTVYERFFQGFSPKEADTHGIVYTPQPIVNFMVRSVEEILKKEFGKSLSDRDVHILDPFVGTGNFIVRIMQEIKKTALPYKYAHELHCNEVMLLPYYIASMNIEHAYLDATGEYKPFEGICLVDTFELAEARQPGFEFMTAKNTERVNRQRQAPIFVILGNPPYNAGQQSETDENKNRKYQHIDSRVTETYAKKSSATLLRKLQDPYVKAIRWASDRLRTDGLVAFVSNSSFVHEHSLDGMRACLPEDFKAIYILDLRGNVHKNPKISGTTHNVFGIKPGVCISFLVRKGEDQSDPARLFYQSVGEFWRKEEKYQFLDGQPEFFSQGWQELHPDSKHTWLTESLRSEYEEFTLLGDKNGERCIFADFSLGVSTNRDDWVYAFKDEDLRLRVKEFVSDYNTEVARFVASGRPKDIDQFVRTGQLKWSRNLKRHLRGCDTAVFDDGNFRRVTYRPFTETFLYLADVVVDEPGRTDCFVSREPNTNVMLCVTGPGSDKPFVSLATDSVVDLHLVGSGCTTQCFPFYVPSQNGPSLLENITDWALEQFRAHYKDKSITKWDIFYYTYAVLHHPGYRSRYAANLKRELPRIPYAPDFHAFAKAGKRLADLHVDYEKQKEYPLERKEKPGEKLNLRVEKMRLTAGKQTLVYNDFLTLAGIPPETFDYRLGNRSALEWVIDQYQVSTDKRSGITNDPNRPDDPEYILRLIGQVITVSLETVKIVQSLPTLGLSTT